MPLGYEVFAGNTADVSTVEHIVEMMEARYGKSDRIWVMDRGIPTEDSLAEMRAKGASYLVGTPKGRLTKLAKAFLEQPWARVRQGNCWSKNHPAKSPSAWSSRWPRRRAPVDRH